MCVCVCARAGARGHARARVGVGGCVCVCVFVRPLQRRETFKQNRTFTNVAFLTGFGANLGFIIQGLLYFH